MHIRCPHCKNPVDVVDDNPSTLLTCVACGSSFSLLGSAETLPPTRRTKQTIGRFELLDQVGMGQFGSVWKARDTELDRIVAVKIPRGSQMTGDEAELFLREARAAAQLKHPHIVSTHEVGREDETIYIVSDFVQGANLGEWLTSQRLTLRESAELCVSIAKALHHAHEARVIHRDLKPSNVMMDLNGAPHLMDFGLAKREAGEITMTRDGHILGTPAYMSPEQASGKGHSADRRTDIYSLGVILFELLTGERPFRGDERMLIVQILTTESPSPRKLNSRIPKDLETICLKCLEKDPIRRYATAEAVADDLERWLKGEPIIARPISRLSRGWRWCKRNRSVASMAATIALILFCGIVVSTYFAVTAEQQTRRAQRNLRTAQEAIDLQFTKVSENDALIDNPQLGPLRKDLIDSAMRYYEQFAFQNSHDRQIQASLAAANFRVANMQFNVGANDWSDYVGKGVGILEKLVVDELDEREIEGLGVGLYRTRGRPTMTVTPPRDFKQAKDVFERGVKVYRQLAERFPRVPAIQNDLAGFLHLYALFNGADAENALGEASKIWEGLLDQDASNPDLCASLVTTYGIRIDRLVRRGEVNEAETLLRRTIELQHSLTRDFPEVEYYKSSLELTQSRLAELSTRRSNTVRDPQGEQAK